MFGSRIRQEFARSGRGLLGSFENLGYVWGTTGNTRPRLLPLKQIRMKRALGWRHVQVREGLGRRDAPARRPQD